MLVQQTQPGLLFACIANVQAAGEWPAATLEPGNVTSELHPDSGLGIAGTAFCRHLAGQLRAGLDLLKTCKRAVMLQQ